ncbi:MAG: hypothetical protein J7L34_03695, partial [Thermotogaceae bacterium]|nr:hypothetical protein [Thermotogaceae bacterium]
MKATWLRKNVAKVHIKEEGTVKKGALDVKVDEKGISFKKRAFPIFEAKIEKAHLLFKVFPSEVFVYDDMPFQRNKSLEINNSYSVFFDKYQALAIYFTKSVKMYIDGIENNQHVSTPAVDFYVSYAKTPLEAVKSLRSVIRVPPDTIGTYLNLSQIKQEEEKKEYIASFEGDGIYFKKKDEKLIDFANSTGKK